MGDSQPWGTTEMTSKAYPDDASPQECLEYLKMCLKSHQDGVRIIGNLRICDAVRSIEALEARLNENLSEDPNRDH